MINNTLKVAAGLALSATLFTACCDKTNCDKANESAAAQKNTINYSANETTMQQVEKLELTQEWDKVFPKSEKVDHKKVTFVNNFGIALAADMYIPKDAKLAANGKFPAIAVSGPFGAIKEQSSGLYAQTMAERGFLTIAFDPSFTGESGGMPRRTASPDINTEDFLAAVDFLEAQENVDANRIGIIGICGWGGIGLNAAAADTRIKATTAVTMYDMTRVGGNGYYDSEDNEEARYKARQAIAAQRAKDYAEGKHLRAGGVVDPLPADAPQFVKDYFGYYKTPRGYHKRSGNSNDGWNAIGTQAYANARFLRYTNEIRSAVLVMHGEKAHSLYFGKDAYKYMVEGNPAAGIKANPVPSNKELLVIKDANHTDLYDGGENKNFIPWDKLEKFYTENLK
ncbi:MAG: alpha/beta hydrolase [Fibrobacter sp.]|nr:alpha/beta hydrolase [Fibrobacter sp.]